MNITLGSIVSYVIGVPLALLGFLLTIQTPLGLIPLLAGVLIIPIVRRTIANRLGVEFSRGAAAGIGTVGVIAGVVVFVLVGLSGGGSVPGADVSNVSVTAEDASPADANTALNVRWNSRAQPSVDPSPDSLTHYSANDGEKFVVIRMEITNKGNDSIELTPRMFRLRSSNVEYDYQGLFGSGNSFSDVTLNPGGSYTAWVAYSVPEDMTEAKLIVNQEAFYRTNVSVTFEYDSQMPIDMAE